MKTWFLELLVASFVVSAGSAVPQGEGTFRYRETTGQQQGFYQTTIARDGTGSTVRIDSDDKSYRVKADAALRVISCEIHNHKDSSTVVAERIGTAVKITTGGKTFTREIDTLPWFATMNCMADFILSDRTKERFWVVSADFGEIKSMDKGIAAMKFVAVKKAEKETITCDGAKVNAIKVTVTFTDWRSMFWHADYWFRPADGVLLRSEDVRGGPGTPKTVAELVSEQ